MTDEALFFLMSRKPKTSQLEPRKEVIDLILLQTQDFGLDWMHGLQ